MIQRKYIDAVFKHTRLHKRPMTNYRFSKKISDRSVAQVALFFFYPFVIHLTYSRFDTFLVRFRINK